jgi:site-specific DNA-methyltransferase (adenine-specific)
MDDRPDYERWQTPPEIFDPLMREFNFDLDAAADAQTTRLPQYLNDALALDDWPGDRIWLNPPYGRKLEPFVRRAAAEAAKGKLVVALIPFRCCAAWWHEAVIGRATEVRCVRKRIKFIRLDGSRPSLTGSCDSCVVVWDGMESFNFEPGDGSISVNLKTYPIKTLLSYANI